MTTEVAVQEAPPKASPCAAKIAKVAPRRKGFLRDIKFLWEDGDTSYHRVNYYDLKDENKIKRSLFIKVTPMRAIIE
jgi:hypothetical protein